MTGRLIKINVIGLLLQGIPEGIALTTLAFVIAGIPLQFKTVLLTGTLLEVIVYIVRLIPIPLGFHTILAIFLLFLVLSVLNKGDFGKSFIISLLSCIILILLETACFFLLPLVIIIIPQSLIPFYGIRIILGDIHVLLLFLLAFLIVKSRKQKGLYFVKLRNFIYNSPVKNQIKP